VCIGHLQCPTRLLPMNLDDDDTLNNYFVHLVSMPLIMLVPWYIIIIYLISNLNVLLIF